MWQHAVNGNRIGKAQWMTIAAVCVTVFAVPATLAQAQQPGEELSAAQATELVRRAVDHSLAQTNVHKPMRFLIHKVDDRHDTLKEVIETKDGDVARLIEQDGKPLSADAEKAELDRLNELLAHPEMQEKRHRGEQKDAERVDRLMKLLPDAFIYKMEGMTPCDSGQCYRLSFTPKPGWNPPDLEASLFRAVSGEVWIDRQQGWMEKLDAHFINDVQVGLGLLAKVNRGGSAEFEQHDVGERANAGHDWEITGMKLNMTGRVIVFKGINMKMHQELTHFELAPPGIDYKEAIRLLESEGARPAVANGR